MNAMAALEQIQAHLTALEQATAEVMGEIYRQSDDYLQALGQALRQQLILAGYHLCTQGYPEAFLSLSLGQRQQLQQDLQDLGQQVDQDCQGLLQHLPPPTHPLDPADFFQALEQLEAAIAHLLTTYSQQANQVLQTSDVLPQGELDLLLEVAAKAEASSGPMATSPANVLRAVIEPEDDSESQGTPLLAIYLRLSEIEFTDAATMTRRNQLRKHLSHLAELQQELSLKRQERTIAEAEAAWRACWSENQKPL